MSQKKFYESRQSAMELKEIKQHPDDNTSVSNHSSDSSFSHNRLSRQQEKQHLAGLNDRLASYIERVRHLETENARLHIQIRDVELVERREKESKIAHYEDKLSEIRNQLEDVSREKAKMELEHAKSISEYSHLKTACGKLRNELEIAKKHADDAARDIHDLESRLNNKERALRGVESEIASSKKRLNEQKCAIGSLRSQLESEVLLKSELERKVAAFKDELEFLSKNYNNQIDEFRRKRQSEMNVFSSEVESRYQAKLQEQLQSMRADFDARIASSRAEIDAKYKNKLAEVSECAARNRSIATEAREEAARYCSAIFDMEGKIASHNVVVDELKERIAELESRLKNARESMNIQMEQRDERISALEDEIASMMNDYQDLMDVKVQLDTELQAYQKLLEGEEKRLHINPKRNSHKHSAQDTFLSGDSLPGVNQPSVRRGAKRRHVDSKIYDFDKLADGCKISIHAEGEVIIEEVDVLGDFIRLSNRSDDNVPIGGWTIRSAAGDKEVSFKFDSRQNIMENSATTVWSKDAEHKISDTPKHIMMKQQSWPVGDMIMVQLFNDVGEEMASYKLAVEGSETGV